MPKTDEVFSLDDYDRIIEALDARLAAKQLAFNMTINGDGATLPYGRNRSWRPEDFGIPQIEALIAKIQTIAVDQAGR